MKQSPTEELNQKNLPIDKLTINDSFKFMIEDQLNAIKAVDKQIKKINQIIKVLVNHFQKNNSGRLVYCGAGTSGRVGVQDAVELYPTFGWPRRNINFIIAGGKQALTKAIENSEDDIVSARESVKKINLSDKDVVFGLTASGNTSFTCEVMRSARINKALTIGISNNPNGKMHYLCDYHILLNTKAEVVAGSTRLKAGTAQKVCLNIISTILMTKLGFVKEGYMINLVPSNEKLRKRKKLIAEILNKK